MRDVEKLKLSPEDLGRGYREDEISFVMRAHQIGLSAAELVNGAEKVREFMSPPSVRPEWAQVSVMADVADERDRARDTAVRLEQELAEAERNLTEQNNDLVKGTLLAVRRQVEHTLTEAGQLAISRAVDRVASNLGVSL